MDTKTKKYGRMALLGVLVVGVVLISGCTRSSVYGVKNVCAEVDSNDNIIVHWDSPFNDQYIIEYHVYWSRDSEFPQDNRNGVSTHPTTLSYTIEELEHGNWYIRVRGYFLNPPWNHKIEGPWSETITVTIPRNKEETSTANLLTYNDETNGFTISYPQHWEEIPRQYWEGMQTEEGEMVTAFWSSYPHKLNFIVWKEELSSPMSLQNYYEVKKEKVKERALMLNNYAFISAEDLAIDGIPAKKHIFTHSTPSGRPAKSMHVYMVKNQTAWAITFSGEPASFDDFKSTFEAIISSLSLQE